MVYRLDGRQINSIIRLCLKDGKIRNQLVMKRYSLPVPESLVIHRFEKRDLKIIEEFIHSDHKEYQLRSENIGSELRYSESSNGLVNDSVISEIYRLRRKGELILLQKLPFNSLARDEYSAQYFIYIDKLIIEIRAGIAPHLGRCGWTPSEYYSIPIHLFGRQFDEIKFSKYGGMEDKSVLKKNLFLDTIAHGLKYVSRSKKFNKVLELPFDSDLHRVKKIYEISLAERRDNLLGYTADKDLLKKNYLEMANELSREILDRWLIEFNISNSLEKMSLEQFLSNIGFITKYNEQDKLDNLKNRLRKFISENILYEELSNKYFKVLLKHAKQIKELLHEKTAKLSLIQTEDGPVVLYWDLISWRK